jgi:predicted secreted protein
VRSYDSKGNKPGQQDQQHTTDTGNNVRSSHVRTQQNRTQNFNQNSSLNSDQNQSNNQNHSSDVFDQNSVNRFQQNSTHQAQQYQQHQQQHQQQQQLQQQHEFNPQFQVKKIVMPDRDMKGRFCFEMQSKGEMLLFLSLL